LEINASVQTDPLPPVAIVRGPAAWVDFTVSGFLFRSGELGAPSSARFYRD